MALPANLAALPKASPSNHDLVTPRWWSDRLELATKLQQQPRPTNRDDYHGQYRSNQRNGLGVVRCTNGDVYIGEWAAGVRSGAGACVFANGDLYEGAWVDSKMHGKGTYVDAKSETWEGDFFNGNGPALLNVQ